MNLKPSGGFRLQFLVYLFQGPSMQLNTDAGIHSNLCAIEIDVAGFLPNPSAARNISNVYEHFYISNHEIDPIPDPSRKMVAVPRLIGLIEYNTILYSAGRIYNCLTKSVCVSPGGLLMRSDCIACDNRHSKNHPNCDC